MHVPRPALILLAVVCLGFVPVAGHAEPTCDRACKIAAAQSYLDALVSHDASPVPFAATARRVENLAVTGRSGEGLRRDLNRNIQYRVIKDIRDERFWVDGDDVLVTYLIDTAAFPGGPQILTTITNERFRVVNGQITEIEVVFSAAPGRVRQAWR